MGDIRGFCGSEEVRGVAPVPPDVEGRVSGAKLALMKALGVISNTRSKLASHALTASALSAAVLTYFRLPWRPVAGHFTLPGFPYAIPHVWLVTDGLPAGDGITDITYTDAMRQIKLFGQGITIANSAEPAAGPAANAAVTAPDDGVVATYIPGPYVAPPAGVMEGSRGVLPSASTLNVEMLEMYASNLRNYMREAPETVRKAAALVLTKALDGTNSITIERPV